MVTAFAKVKVKAVIALIPHILNRHHPTSIAFHHLLFGLTRLHYHLNSVLVRLVTSHFQALVRGCEVTVLAEAEVRAVGAHKAGPDNWLHIAAHTFLLIMRRQTIRQQRNLHAFKWMLLAQNLAYIQC
jgi:hypothetical protein